MCAGGGNQNLKKGSVMVPVKFYQKTREGRRDKEG